jgi:DNA invertase Pin-like site-specific DNA recombinase
MKELYKVGIYCRLSLADAFNSAKAKNYIPADESVSIENQYEMLSKFVMLNGWTEVKTYTDDGYSGGNFQRPGFQEMLEDARKGIINLILVKDLSRLGRDFVEVGRYTDVVFPSLRCRFVSVLDCLDTEGDNTDMLHFRSLMNDYHLKDLSNKVKSVLHAKMKSGQYLAAYAPYGYRKSDGDKHRLEIDEEAAAVVRRMFDLRRDGVSYGKIAAALNSDGIPSPRWHWATHYGNGTCKYAKLWMYATVKNVLNNEAYLGNLIQNQTGSRSYKDKTTIQKPETDWICHENAFDAIISPDVWDAVQKVNRLASLRSVNNAAPQPCLFTGKLICADCKGPLLANRETQHRKSGGVKKYVSYFCGRYVNSGRSACSRHGISEIKLKKIVMTEIRARAEALEFDETAVLDMLKEQMSADDVKHQEDTRQEVSKLRRRIQELERMTAKLYEDKVGGTISEAAFTVLIQKNEQERLQKAQRLDTFLSEIKESEQDAANIQNWAAIIRKHLHLQELDRETVDELIDHIEIGEHTDVNGQYIQNIKVFYRFIGAIET